MAVKRSVLEIDVDDKKFERYVKSFEKYREHVDKLPGQWKEVSEENMAVVNATKLMTASMLANMDVMRQNVEEQKKVSEHARKTSQYWESIQKNTSKVGVKLKEFFQWSGVAGAVGGLAMGGAVWGLERLASSAGHSRRSATGLGVSYGEQTAFGLSYNRLLDSASFMRSVSQGRGDVTSDAAVALMSLGMAPGRSGSTGEMSAEALERIRKLTKSVPQGDDRQLGFLLHGRNLGALGLGVEDLRRIQGASDQDWTKLKEQYVGNKDQLNVMDETLKRWQEFEVLLEKAGIVLKKSFLNGLEGLTEPFGKLSTALSGAIESFMKSDGFKWVIDKIAHGLNWFADYVSTPKFKKDIEDLVQGIGQFAKAIIDGMKWLGLIPGYGKDASGNPQPEPKMLRDTPGSPFYVDRPDPTNPGAPSGKGSGYKMPFQNRMTPELKKGWWDRTKDTIGGWLKSPMADGGQATWTPEEMDAWKKGITGIESDFAGDQKYGVMGPITNSGDRAYGKYQVMGSNIAAWTKQYVGKAMTPVQFLHDEQAQEKVFEGEFGRLVKKYGPRGAARAWFAGEGGMNNLDATDATSTYKGISVREYDRRFAGALPVGQPQGKIVVENRSGSTVGVSTGAIGITGIGGPGGG